MKDRISESWAGLPHATNADGALRRVGVEIEFGGLGERDVAVIVQECLGGRVSDAGAFELRVEGTCIGEVEIVLDTALRKRAKGALAESMLDLARGLIPVEIVTEPLSPEDLPQLDRLVARLREAGAIGSADGVFLGFGVHFNIEVVAPDHPHTCATVLSYGLVEAALRERYPIDVTRRWLPFVDPWPKAFVTALCRRDLTLEDQRAAYAELVHSRNHGLDLLPLYKAADEAAFAALFPDKDGTKGRPAFHYRLPDCRIDEPEWSLAAEWESWALVERCAADTARLSDLRAAWLDQDGPLSGAGEWAAMVAPHLQDLAR